METAEHPLPAGDWTFIGLFRRERGVGPLLESLDGSLQIAYDHDGLVACRVSDEVRVTAVTTEAITDRWAIVMLRKRSQRAELWIDGKKADDWPVRPDTDAQGLRMMRDVDGGVREVAVYAAAVDDSKVEGLTSYLDAKKGGGGYVEFRRGDVPRKRSE